LIDRLQSVLRPYASRRSTSNMMESIRSNRSILKSSSPRRPLMQSSGSEDGDHHRPDSIHAVNFASRSGGGRAPTHDSTHLYRAECQRFSTPNDQIEEGDFELFPPGLTVQSVFDREHSVLLPPPVTFFDRYQGYAKMAPLSTGNTTYTNVSTDISDTTTSPSETYPDESTLTSFYHDEGSSSPGSEASEVCMSQSPSESYAVVPVY
jgi:hypothetical protein